MLDFHLILSSLPLYASGLLVTFEPVSYTHLDVYKRQPLM